MVSSGIIPEAGQLIAGFPMIRLEAKLSARGRALQLEAGRDCLRNALFLYDLSKELEPHPRYKTLLNT